MKRILFVDDEPMILEAMERMLSRQRQHWNMRFAVSGAEALRLMAETPADLVISDMRMPGMNGAQLLNEIRRLHPRTVRIILSGYADLEMIEQCIAGTHQFLAKPCGGETLRNTIKRALELDAWLENDAVKTAISRLAALPSIPSLYFEIQRELESPEGVAETVGAIIARDPAMTAKTLQLVNSAFFGLHRRLLEPAEAVMQLGFETIRSLVLGIHIFSGSETKGATGADSRELWQHSLAVAARARRIAISEHFDKDLVEAAFTGGLLHDVGRLVLLSNLPAEYAVARKHARSGHLKLEEAERLAFGASHAEVGGYLLALWGLPLTLVETAIFHHEPGRCPHRELSALAVVHAANVLELETRPDPNPANRAQLDRQYLVEVGLWERVPRWRKASDNTELENQIT